METNNKELIYAIVALFGMIVVIIGLAGGIVEKVKIRAKRESEFKKEHDSLQLIIDKNDIRLKEKWKKIEEQNN